MARSTGTSTLPFDPPRDLATNTSRSHTPVRSGGSRRTISGACSRVTERAQPSARETSSPATRTGASNALPSSRARNASVTSLPVRTTGGAAGTSMRRALSRPMASTMPVSAERVTARASTLGSRAATLPGMASTTSARRSGSTSAGVQRTAYDACSPRAEPVRRRRCRSTGTIAPRAASSTAHIATLPSQRTLGPTSSRTSPEPAATSQPRTSPTGAATAAALSPPGTGTSGCAVHGAAGASASARNLATSSASGGGTAGAAGPGDDPPGFPRELEPHDAGFDDVGFGRAAWAPAPGRRGRRAHPGAARR